MRKLINAPESFVDEVLDGLVTAHPDAWRLSPADGRVLMRANRPVRDQVGIVTGGGSGHLPLFLGYVGEGLLSAAAVGNVFSSPSPETVLEATKRADAGRGVVYLYGNYGGDVLNFDLAAARAEQAGIITTTVLGADDVLSASANDAPSRRGVAGIVFAFKVAGAAAARGDSLEQVAAIARQAVQRTVTAGVGLAPTILPTAGRPTFELPDGQMEIGVGIHGEPGVARLAIEPVDDVARRLVAALVAERKPEAGDQVAVLINGLGATPSEELYLLYRAVVRQLDEEYGAVVALNFIGEYATSLEMAGASVSIMHLDKDLEALLLAPAESPLYRPGYRVARRATIAVAESGADVPEDVVALARFESPARARLLRLAEQLPAHSEELRQLDAQVGDGDLGVTVAEGCARLAQVVAALPRNTAQTDLLARAGAAFASGNPSTFASLIGIGAAKAAAIVDDSAPLTAAGAARYGAVMADAIAVAGKSSVGEKTLLDLLSPAMEVLSREGRIDARTVDVMIAELAALPASRGRAFWHREQSVGVPDPGAVAVGWAIKILSEPDSAD